MKSFSVIIISIILINPHLLAQNGDYTAGARSQGIAGASLTISDEWALFNNVGALSDAQKTSVFATYRNLYGVPELSSLTAGFITPLWNGTIGLGVYRYGQELLNEHRVNLGFSNRFGIVSLGANISYYQLSIENIGNTRNFMFDFGGRAEIYKQLLFAAHISNLNQAKLSRETDELVPTYMKAGLSYRPNDDLMLNTEVEKNLEDPLRFKIGLEYYIIQAVAFRMGFRTQPFIGNFGVGFHFKRLTTDYAYGVHQDLGGIHEVSIAYNLKRK